MFFRRRTFRKLVIHAAYVSSPRKDAPLGLLPLSTFPHLSSSYAPKPPLVGPNLGPEVRPNASLHSLKDGELLNIIRRTVETRKEVPSRERRGAEKSYSRASGTTYTNVYLELRRRGTHSLMTTYPEVFVYIAKYCMVSGEMKVLDSAVGDIIELTDQIREGGGNEKVVERHYRAIGNILSVLSSSHAVRLPGPIPLQQHFHVLDLFKKLVFGQHLPNSRPGLTLDTLDGVLKSIISLSADWNRIIPLLEPLLQCIHDLPTKEPACDQKIERCFSRAEERTLNSISSKMHRLVHLMLIREMHTLSFTFVETLLQKGLIPSQAIRQSDSEFDFHTFMIFVLLRWSAFCGWSDRALQVLRTEDPTGTKLQKEFLLGADIEAEYLQNTKFNTGFLSGEERVQAEEFSQRGREPGAIMGTREQKHYSTLANSLLSSFIAADPSKLAQCAQITGLMLSRLPVIRLNNSLIHKFFKTAREVNAAGAAEFMYATLRSTCDLDQYINGLLHGGVVPWLLGHLVYRSKKRGLAERLVLDLIKSPNEISSFERGDVIAICADAGFVAETRSLWERYAVGPASKMVTGHTKCMVGIVKLFKRISDVTTKISRGAEHGKQDIGGTKETKFGDVATSELPDYSSDQGPQSHDIGTAALPTIPRRISVGEKIDSGVVPLALDPSLGARGSVKRDGSIESNPIPEADAFEPESSGTLKASSTSQHDVIETALSCSDVEHHDQRDDPNPVTRSSVVSDDPGPDDYIVFAHKVLDAYRRAKEPLHRASHYDLNALARASDMLGSVRQSMQALQTIVDRKEIPDTYDMNVVMIAMAARDPLRAEDMLGLMLQEGMHLNALTFTAVIAGWLKKGNTKRASRVYSRAMRAGHAKLTVDVGTNLLSALVDSCSSSVRATIEQDRIDMWMHRTFLRQAYSLIKTESYRVSAPPHDLGERCIGAGLRLEEPGLAFLFWKQLLKTTTHNETDQQRQLRQEIAKMVKEVTKKGKIRVEERERMIIELGPL